MDLTYNAEKLLGVQDDDLERAAKQYNLTLSTVEETLKTLRDWYKMQPHLPQGVIEDRKLLRHCWTKGFSIERTKENLNSYYNARNITPEFTSNRDPMSKSIENVFKVAQIITLPQKTSENYRVTILRLLNTDASLFNVWEAFKLSFMIGDYRLMNDTVIGDQFIIYLGNIKVGHVAQITPTLVVKSLFYLQSCIGAKIKGIHLVGLPSYAEAMVSMFKKALSTKVAKRFYTYSTFEELKTVFPVKIIPKDLGGEAISTEEIMENWKQTLQSPAWRKWFLEQEKVKSDESLRPADCSTADELMGIHGSFRKLDVD